MSTCAERFIASQAVKKEYAKAAKIRKRQIGRTTVSVKIRKREQLLLYAKSRGVSVSAAVNGMIERELNRTADWPQVPPRKWLGPWAGK